VDTAPPGTPADDLLALEQAHEPDRLARLIRLAARLSRAVTTPDVAASVVAAGRAELGADAVIVYRLDEDAGVFQQIAETGATPSLMARFSTVPLDAPLPAGDAVTGGDLVVYETIEERNRRWPAIGSVEGAPTTVVAPMLLNGGLRVGVLSLSWRDPRPVDDADRAFCRAVAHLCAQALHRAELYAASQERAGRLEEALESRVVVEQAKGVLAERHGVDVAAAFESLRAEARRTRQPIHDLARQVLAGEVDLPPTSRR
jgi:GAF domain-containing protein